MGGAALKLGRTIQWAGGIDEKRGVAPERAASKSALLSEYLLPPLLLNSRCLSHLPALRVEEVYKLQKLAKYTKFTKGSTFVRGSRQAVSRGHSRSLMVCDFEIKVSFLLTHYSDTIF